MKLIADLQQVYLDRYGEVDITPVDPAQFAAPLGHFVVGYVDEVPVACGGWRAHDVAEHSLRPGDAEIKRMYVVDAMRGRGLAPVVLKSLEAAARAAGRTRMVLETGLRQPEAIGLYRANGYARIDNFGVYRHHPESLCFAKDL